jgi:hypothetical protein
VDVWWMEKGGGHTKEWMNKTKEFVDRAFSLANNGGVKCPCNKYRNSVCEDKRMLSLHLCKVGFMPGNEVWVHHGESVHQIASVVEDDDSTSDDRMDEMLDAIRSEFGTNTEYPPTPEVQKFFGILRASEEPLHKHTTVSVLNFVTRLMAALSSHSSGTSSARRRSEDELEIIRLKEAMRQRDEYFAACFAQQQAMLQVS